MVDARSLSDYADGPLFELVIHSRMVAAMLGVRLPQTWLKIGFGYGRSEDAADTCLSRSSNKDVVQLERSEASTDAGDSVVIRIGHGYGTDEPLAKRFRLL